jgi:hypothetical protein
LYTPAFGQVHMCWYVSSAEKRANLAFNPSDLDTSLCSHLIYSYSIIDPETVNLSFLPNEDVRGLLLSRFQKLSFFF